MKKERRVAAAPDRPVEQTIATGAIAATTPVIDVADTRGTVPAAAPAVEVAPAPEPITRPTGGGSYVRDRRTGQLTRQEA